MATASATNWFAVSSVKSMAAPRHRDELPRTLSRIPVKRSRSRHFEGIIRQDPWLC